MFVDVSGNLGISRFSVDVDSERGVYSLFVPLLKNRLLIVVSVFNACTVNIFTLCPNLLSNVALIIFYLIIIIVYKPCDNRLIDQLLICREIKKTEREHLRFRRFLFVAD